jgi:hypothetical protein
MKKPTLNISAGASTAQMSSGSSVSILSLGILFVDVLELENMNIVLHQKRVCPVLRVGACMAFRVRSYVSITNALIRRIPFTAEDDEHLAFYIATVFPDVSDGGRSGNLIYKELTEELVRDQILSVYILIHKNTLPRLMNRNIKSGRKGTHGTPGANATKRIACVLIL